MRTPLRTGLTALCALALVAPVPGCKKEQQAAGGKKTDNDKPSSPTKDAPRTTPRRRPPRPRIRVSPKVLPIPADMPALRFNVQMLRQTAWFKRSEAALRKRLVAPSRIAAALTECGTDPIRNVEGATVGASLAPGRLGDLIVVMKIDRKTDAVLSCLQKTLGKHKLQARKTTLAGRPGLAFRHAGRAATVVALRHNQLMIIIGELTQRVADVLGGKSPSIASTTLYNEVNAQVGPDSLFGGIFPGLPTGKEEHLPKLLRGFRTGALIVSLPKGRSALRVNLHFEDREKARAVTRKLPELLQLATSRYPGVKDPKTPGAKPRKGWAYLDFKLEDRTFQKITALLAGLISPPAKPSPKRPQPKK